MNNLLFIDIYRKAFAAANNTNRMWDDTTLYYYFAIVLFSVLIGWIAENKKKRNDRKGLLFCFYLISFFLAFILGFRSESVGIDTINYRTSFDNAFDYSIFDYESIEPGFHLLQIIIGFLFSGPSISIIIFSFFTVFFVFKGLWKQRDSISIFIAFSIYVGIFYFQAMNLLRIYLAAAIILWKFDYLIKKQYTKFVVVILIAATIHFSSLVMFLPLGFLWLRSKSNFLALGVTAAMLAFAVSIAMSFSSYLNLLRYAEYGDNNNATGNIGFMLFFEYLPCLYFIVYAYRKKIFNQWYYLLISFTCVGFSLKVLSYYVEIVGRLGIHFMGLFILLIPYFINEIRKRNRRKYIMVCLVMLLYVFVRLHFYFIGYLSSDGIMPYNFIWNN